jgi:hypothetical protein
MNNVQHEQLFTDLNPSQSEAIAAAKKVSIAANSFGIAEAVLRRTGSRSFDVDLLSVRDESRDDGLPVYARIQAEAPDGSFMITPTDRFGSFLGTFYSDLKASFNKPVKQARVLLFRGQPGRGLNFITRGNWVDGR